jgi:nicotinamide mononucleotide adenylyltransferase
MKNFLRFLSEARESQASLQAKKLGLTGDGHGGWLNRSGKMVAKTEGGKLVFLDGRQASKEPSAQAKGVQAPVTSQPQSTKAQVPASQRIQAPAPEEEVPEEGGTLTIVFGRFNPPTIGHDKTFNMAKKVSVGGDLKIYPSRTQDPKKNPLSPEVKIHYMRKMFPQYEDNIIDDPDMKTIFNVLVTAAEEGYANVNIVCGSDRQSEFENLAQKYNGDLYNFDLIRVISAGVRDADAEGVMGMSASKMRKAVMDNDFATFRRGTPKTLDDAETQALFDQVRQGMKIKKTKVQKESYNLWEIAPKYDMKNLRENYVTGKIFKIGDKIQNLNTGLIGEVMRRGTNHLICVTEEGYMFKSWIKDLTEYTEVKMDSPMRDKTHPNTLVGTLGAFKHYASKTPGAIETGKENLQYGGKAYGVNFINKYRKIKESIYSNG